MSSREGDERDLIAHHALAILAEAITDAGTRGRHKDDPRAAIEEALAKGGRTSSDLPPDVVEFFAGLSAEELQTLARLQETMVGVRDQGFPSLTDRVLTNSFASLAKL